MPKPKMDKDGKPVLDDAGNQVMEMTVEEQLADVNKKLDDRVKADEARDAELKRTQLLNKQLLAKLDGGGMDASRTVRQNDDGTPDFSTLDFVNNPNEAVKAVVQTVVQNVQTVMSSSEHARRQKEQLRTKFYSDNPDLKGYEDIVAIQANKIDSEGSFVNDTDGAFAEAAKRARLWLKEKGIVSNGTKEPPVVLPGGGSSGDGNGNIPKKDEPFDEAKEQSNALADEIKSRTELTGKRTTR